MTSFSGNITDFPLQDSGFSGEPWDVVTPGFFLPADWSEPVRVTTNWQTSIVPNQKDGESRRALIGRPTRKVDASVLALNQSETAKQLSLLSRSGFSRTLFPLYPDQVNPSKDYSSGTSTIEIQQNLAYYRFLENQNFVIYDPETGDFEIRQISSVTTGNGTSEISFNIAVPKANKNSLIMPMIQSRLRLDSDAEAITDRVLRSSMTGQELPGNWTLPPANDVNQNPPMMQTYNGLPVWTMDPDFKNRIKINYTRTGRYTGVGTTQIASVYGDKARQSRSFEVEFDRREDYWELLRLFDSRAGRTHSWYLPSFTSEYEITQFTPGGIRVKSFGPIEDWDFRPLVSITLFDGTIEIRQISTVTTNGEEDIIVFSDGAFNETDLSKVDKAGSAQQVRFQDDEIVEEWSTDGVVTVDFSVVEVIQENTITLPDLTEILTSPVTSPYEPVSCDTTPDCVDCDECANCLFASDPSGSRLLLEITSATANASNNGLDSSFASFLEQNSPFDIPYLSTVNDYFLFEKKIKQSPNRYIEVLIRYDCLLGEWWWSYRTEGLGTSGVTYRACGSCSIQVGGGDGGEDPTGCNSTLSGGFGSDCWNNPRNGASSQNDNWNIAEEPNAEAGCNGIAGWKDHTSTDYIQSLTGVPDGQSAIMWGIQGEWTVEQDTPCCPAPQPCIQCLNDCLFILNCNPEPIEDTTIPCFLDALGLPAVDGGGVVTCNDCAITITPASGQTSCCRGDGSQCQRVDVSMANNCLFNCSELDGLSSYCERTRQ